MKAIWKDKIIAESNDTIVIEGNHYFPPSAINEDFLEESSNSTTCHWKGEASYKSIKVNGEINKDAAWFYSNPKPMAKEIKNYYAFWKGVVIEK